MANANGNANLGYLACRRAAERFCQTDNHHGAAAKLVITTDSTEIRFGARSPTPGNRNVLTNNQHH